MNDLWRVENHLENRNGELYIGGCSSIELAEKYGTPLYVLDEGRIRERARLLNDSFKRFFAGFKLYYAIKANSNQAVLNILRQEGCGVDCASPAEIQLALKNGFGVEEILYTSCYNRDDELAYACSVGVKMNLDDLSIFRRLLKYARVPEVPPVICFRFNPGIGASGMEKLVFAGPEAKFGMLEERLFEAYRMAREAGFNRFGIHMMTGSNILNAAYFPEVAGRLFDVSARISEELGIDFEFMNLGGGFGVTYKPFEKELDVKEIARSVFEVFREKNVSIKNLFIEPGRFIVCDAGVLLSRVTCVKNSAKKFVGIDAGMNVLVRPAMYGSYHHVLVANKLDESDSEEVTVVGPLMENTDRLASDRLLPRIEEGDLLAVLNAGAYGFSMSSQYNTRPRPAEVLTSNGGSELIRERESFEDLVRNQRVPERLLK